MLARVAGSNEAVRALQRLLSLKNDAEYGLVSITATRRTTALRQAGKIVGFAEQAVLR